MPELVLAIVDGSRVVVPNDHPAQRAVQVELAHSLGQPAAVDCARPLTLVPFEPGTSAPGTSARVSGMWHGSLVEGPGVRSVVRFQGCPIHCVGCYVPETWDATAGTSVSVDTIADVLMAPNVATRDGVSILGGEPFAQPAALAALVLALRQRGCANILVYSGFTFERLSRRAIADPAIAYVLAEIDTLIDGPYIAALSAGATPYTGSGNQRILHLR